MLPFFFFGSFLFMITRMENHFWWGPGSSFRLAGSAARGLNAKRKELANSIRGQDVALAAGVGVMGYRLAEPEVAGLRRGAKFWKYALPIYREYRLAEQELGKLPAKERRKKWDAIHQKYGPRILEMIQDLRGFYVKIGQVCSTRHDMFPKAWVDNLAQLQGEHPNLLARPLSEIWPAVQKELGPELSMKIKKVDETPLGAAATGQVHGVTLKDGRKAVMKVQYPDVERFFRQDFANAKLFCALLQREHLGYLNELQAQFQTEFDYRREARDLAEISSRFEKGKDNPYAGKVRIPKPVPELATKNVVVMEYLPGETLLHYARRRKMECENGGFFGRYWGCWRLQKELQGYLDLLTQVQGHQIFVDGVFNGDPHPGNVLRLDDGKLGLIDYGNVKRLTIKERTLLGRLILALAADEPLAVISAAKELGFETRDGNDELLFRYAQLWFDRDDAESMVCPDGRRPTNIQLYLECLNEKDPLVNTPEGFLMVARNSFLLRGIGTQLGLQPRMSQQWKKFAERAVKAGSPGQAASKAAPKAAPKAADHGDGHGDGHGGGHGGGSERGPLMMLIVAVAGWFWWCW
eukprot:TRINITY_DN14410_c0_g1_i1.p1 TRINITY_DN14410_c0_g1~~TRINITY_DN14410_c0_g1_i1.p1  ORF type:complete len:579 (-),score=118.79 TRINITY_DN14410_c0_g1_i1:15-1751(-)